MKKILSVVFVLSLLFCLSACSSKEAISSDGFVNYFSVNNPEFSITDITSQYDSSTFSSAIIASDESDGYNIEFYVLLDESKAGAMYSENVDIISNFVENSNVKSTTSVNLGNHSKFVAENGQTYWVISCINNTLIYVEADSIQKDEIKSILEGLGY